MTRVFFSGQPIEIQFRPGLRVSRGKLICGGNRGREVHAGAFLKRRLIVLDRALLRDARERDRILAHELFHFVWWKLGRVRRNAYRALICEEVSRSIPGEMGWSSELHKERLGAGDWLQNTRPVHDYLCESFCDTAAAYLLQLTCHDEITLSRLYSRRRNRWMESWIEETLPSGGLRV